jgi:hypothetical protein
MCEFAEPRTPDNCATITNVGQCDTYPPPPRGMCSVVNRCENPCYASVLSEDGRMLGFTEYDLDGDTCPVTCTN